MSRDSDSLTSRVRAIGNRGASARYPHEMMRGLLPMVMATGLGCFAPLCRAQEPHSILLYGTGDSPAGGGPGTVSHVFYPGVLPRRNLSPVLLPKVLFNTTVDTGTIFYTELVLSSGASRTLVDDNLSNFGLLNPLAAGGGAYAYSSTPSSITTFNIRANGTNTNVAQTGQTVPGIGGSATHITLNFENVPPGVNLLVPTLLESQTSSNGGSVILTDDSLNGGSQLIVASTSTTAPVIGGNFVSFADQTMNNGTVAFTGTNAAGVKGIFTSVGGVLSHVVNSTQTVPIIGGHYSQIFPPLLNAGGNLAFLAQSNGFGNRYVILTAVGTTLTPIANTFNTPAPDLGNSFVGFVRPSAVISASTVFPFIDSNDAGDVALFGTTDFSNGGIFLYKAASASISAITTTNHAAPNLTGNFVHYDAPGVSGSGTVIFSGATSTGTGIYLGDAREIITAAFTGQSVVGSTITTLSYFGGANVGGQGGWNDDGQVTYNAVLADGRTGNFLFTPDLFWRGPGTTWDGPGNWTVSLQPNAPHNVFIYPTIPLTLVGPSQATTVQSLNINGQGPGVVATLEWGDGPLTTTDGLTVGSQGALRGPGIINGPVIINPGGVVEDSTGSLAINGAVTNNGLMQFTGGSVPAVTGAFINNGILDVITAGPVVYPPGFVNNGTILDPSLVKVKQLTKNGAGATVTIHGYPGHTYQLQRSSSLTSDNFMNVGDPVNCTSEQDIPFLDLFGGPEGFYHVVVN
jgi:hypothetical protein